MCLILQNMYIPIDLLLFINYKIYSIRSIDANVIICEDICRMGPHSVYIAQYDYLPQRVDELALMKGDIVRLVEEVEDGWAKGEVSRHKTRNGRSE